MMLSSHGTAALRFSRASIRTDYHPADGCPGILTLEREDLDTYASVEGRLRLDPWIGEQYGLLEFRTGSCFVICGAQAVVSVDMSTLALLSSVALEYEEGETIDVPWHVEIESSRLFVIATERRVWCLDERGTIRWLWSCATSERDTIIAGEPVATDRHVSVPLRIANGTLSVELQLSDGLPVRN